jgi:predicted nucleic acid-binding Zn ribbon protein
MCTGSAYDGCINCGNDIYCDENSEFDSKFCSLKCEEEFLKDLKEESGKS